MVISCRRFGTTYRSHLQGSRIQKKTCYPTKVLIKGRAQFSVDNLTKVLNIRRNVISYQQMLNIRRNARINNFGAVFQSLSNLPICSSPRSRFKTNFHKGLLFRRGLQCVWLPKQWKHLSRQIKFIIRLIELNVPKLISQLCVTLRTGLRVLKCCSKIYVINSKLL